MTLRRFAVFTLFTLFLTAAASAQTKYKTYSNGRFFFEIEYPATFSMGEAEKAPANDDGRIFTSADGRAEMRAWANYNALFHTTKQEYQWQIENFEAAVGYHALAANWFVISGTSGGKIIYEKTIHRKDKEADVYYTFRIEYPESQKQTCDPIVAHIQRSFKWIPGADI